MPSVRIHDRGRNTFSVNLYDIQSRFPLLFRYTGHGDIHLEFLEPYLEIRSPPRSATIRSILRNLLSTLKRGVGASLSKHVFRRFENDIDFDLDRNFDNPRGLEKGRNLFSTLAAFAELTGSDTLASYLIKAFWSRCDDIVCHERNGKIPVWVDAMDSLRHLVSNHEIRRCQQYLESRYYGSPYSSRGRHMRHPDYYGPRAHTMPPLRRRHHESPGFLPLPYSYPMCSPLPSPVHSMGYVEYPEEQIEEIQDEQDELRERVNLLEENQFAFAEEVGAPMRIIPNLPQLGWVQ